MLTRNPSIRHREDAAESQESHRFSAPYGSGEPGKGPIWSAAGSAPEPPDASSRQKRSSAWATAGSWAANERSGAMVGSASVVRVSAGARGGAARLAAPARPRRAWWPMAARAPRLSGRPAPARWQPIGCGSASSGARRSQHGGGGERRAGSSAICPEATARVDDARRAAPSSGCSASQRLRLQLRPDEGRRRASGGVRRRSAKKAIGARYSSRLRSSVLSAPSPAHAGEVLGGDLLAARARPSTPSTSMRAEIVAHRGRLEAPGERSKSTLQRPRARRRASDRRRRPASRVTCGKRLRSVRTTSRTSSSLIS